jgi:hypothetical protein
MVEWRHLGLCFNCNEKYTRGHNRICQCIFFLDGVDIEDVAEATGDTENNGEAPCFSLQAVAGVPMAGTMQINMALGIASLVALLNSGSMHIFISEEATRRSGLPLHQRPRLTALVVNGERVTCAGVICDAPLLIDGDSFPADLYVMPLAWYDIVLGTRWLGHVGPYVWDLGRRRMSFQRQGRPISWTGVDRPSVLTLGATTETDPLGGAAALVWGALRGPHRSATQVSARPPFLLLVLLVKKPDGSWRFCVDYRALNALTVKDAFPIPMVDELHGAKFFTKLDLQFGYHQVRMRPEDVHKTAFRTHDGLYEFLVMAFGLCNAPVTFQALMNDVLRPFLCHFVLVFFDDILIYSKTWADHLHHLRTVLDELRRHQLFVKRNKCSFGASSVAYLGHVISTAGVAMDPAKVQAIHDWLAPRSAWAVWGFLGLTG